MSESSDGHSILRLPDRDWKRCCVPHDFIFQLAIRQAGFVVRGSWVQVSELLFVIWIADYCCSWTTAGTLYDLQGMYMMRL